MKAKNSNRDIIAICIWWVVLSVVGEWGTNYLIADYPGTYSAQGLVTSDAVFFLLRVALPVMTLVAVIIVYSVLKFHVADDDRTASTVQYRSARAFPWTWVTLSVILNVTFIIHPGVTGLDRLWSMEAQAKSADPMEIDVTAKQWEWTFDYPQQDLHEVSQLVLPVGKTVDFKIESKDVIHSFWVPAWGIKKAAIPGEIRDLIVTPNHITSTAVDPLARVQCSQICGVGHTKMQSALKVVSNDDFNAWVKKTRASEAKDMGGMNMKMDTKMNMQDGAQNAQNGHKGLGGDGKNMPMDMKPNGGNQ